MSDFNYTLARPLPAIDISGDFMAAFGPEVRRAARELTGRPALSHNKIAQVIPLRRREATVSPVIPVPLSKKEESSC